MKTVLRTMLVHDRLVHSLVDEIGAIARPMTRFGWAVADLSDPSNLHKPYGWISPYEVEGDPDDESATIIAPFCPGLIAEQTRFLYDGQFEEYVDIIDYSMSLQIIHRHLPWPEREAAVDHRMWEEASGSMELQNRIQMRILDTLTEAGH